MCCILLSVLVGALSAGADLFITPEPDFVKNGYLCTYLMPTGDDTEISGLAAARIFTPDGRMVRQIVSGGDTTTVELPAGLYIVTAAGRSIKVAVR